MPGLSVGSRPLADRHAIVDVLPVLWGGIGRIDAERLDGWMACSPFSPLGQPEICSRLSPPGRTYGTVTYRSPGATARRMSMRDRVVPYSFPAHRTNAKMLPASKETTRHWRSIMC